MKHNFGFCRAFPPRWGAYPSVLVSFSNQHFQSYPYTTKKNTGFLVLCPDVCVCQEQRVKA